MSSLVEEAMKRLHELADEFNLEEGDERDAFINEGMLRKGFKQVTAWSEPEPESGDGKVRSMFGSGGSGSGGGTTRKVGGERKAPYGY